MKIKINSKSHKIKPADQLTVKEYIALKRGTNGLDMLINYISITTGVEYKNVAEINIDEVSIRRLFAYIGEIPLIEKLPSTKEFYHKKSGKTIYQKNLNWRTLGARKMLENKKTNDPMNQLVYLLAVYLSGNYDNDLVEEIYIELQGYNAIEVFSFIFFFFKKFLNGNQLGINFFHRLLKKVNIKTAT